MGMQNYCSFHYCYSRLLSKNFPGCSKVRVIITLLQISLKHLCVLLLVILIYVNKRHSDYNARIQSQRLNSLYEISYVHLKLVFYLTLRLVIISVTCSCSMHI